MDIKDIPYLAMALQTGSVLLTRDQPIYKAARQNGFRPNRSTVQDALRVKRTRKFTSQHCLNVITQEASCHQIFIEGNITSIDTALELNPQPKESGDTYFHK